MQSVEKIKVYHFSNNTTGGVFSVIQNLLKFSNSDKIENHVIFTINKIERSKFQPPQMMGAASAQFFGFDPKNNFYHTSKKLAAMLPDDRAVVVAHDWLELGMASNLGLKNPVVQFVHGNYDYYYQLAEKHQKVVNEFIAISPSIYTNLIKKIPHRADHIHSLNFPVSEVQAKFNKTDNFSVVYVVRNLADVNKNFQIIPKIDALLAQENIEVDWHIIGEVDTNESINLLGKIRNAKAYGILSNDEVVEVLQMSNLFILPSIREGLPVAMVEAMKAGAIPLINDWAGSTQEIVIDGTTGFYCDVNQPQSFAEKINLLFNDAPLLNKMSRASQKIANERFDPWQNTKAIESIFIDASKAQNHPTPIKSYGSRLDHPRLPNLVTRALRLINKN